MTSDSPAAAGQGGARPLDADEDETWRTFSEAARALFDVLERQLQTAAEMPLAYYDILATLAEAPDGALRLGELARRLRSSSSRLSHAMTRLEASGWARRESMPSDRRGAMAVLTPEGREALAAAAPGHASVVRRHLLDPLTPEQVVQLTEISRAVRDAVPDIPTPRRRRDD